MGLHLRMHVEVDPSNPSRSAPRFGDLERSRAGLAGTLPAQWDGEMRVWEALASL